MENIAGFIDEIRANLSDQAYSNFKSALALYKEVNPVFTATGIYN